MEVVKLRVKVQPNASKTEVLGWVEEPLVGRVLRIRVQAPPIEGAANKELVKFLSKHFKIPKSRVQLLRGESARIKTFELPDGVDGRGYW